MAIDRILLSVGEGDKDRIETLANTVTAVAEPTGAEVHVLHVFSEQGFEDAVSRLNFESTADADPDTVAGRLQFVRELQNELQSKGVTVDMTGAVGDAADSILELSESADIDMVFMGGRKRSPAGKAVFGSAVQEVMLNSPSPVTFVREDMDVN